ncbi:hypothetical protein AX16_000879 [Volvariella volvacea WC 439]|nr:hypothetical protein AX16_000879 [Volvariella volvacea WC 439]
MTASRGSNMLSRLIVVFSFVNILTTLATAVIFQGKGDRFYVTVPWLIISLSALTLMWLATLLLFQRKANSEHFLNQQQPHLWSLYALLPLWLSLAIMISVQTPYWCQGGETRVYKCLVPIASTTWTWMISLLLVFSIFWLCRREGCSLGLRREKSANSEVNGRLVQ